MALTKKVQAGLANAATKLREWLDERVDEQGVEIAQLYQASRDTLTERLRHIYENFLRDEPSVAKARSTGAGTAIQQAIDQTVNTLTEDVGREAVSGLTDTLSLSSSALNKTLAKFAGMELEELPVSSQWVLQELTTKVIGGGTYFDRLLHLGEDLKGNLYSTVRQGLISGQDFDTVREKFHRAFGVENAEEPKFNAYGSVNIYKNEARRQWNLLMKDHAKRMGGVEVWWAKQPFDTESTPGCVARHGMAINALGERPQRHYNCRCTVAVFPGEADLTVYQAEAEAWLNKMGYTRKAAMLEEALREAGREYSRDEMGRFAGSGTAAGLLKAHNMLKNQHPARKGQAKFDSKPSDTPIEQWRDYVRGLRVLHRGIGSTAYGAGTLDEKVGKTGIPTRSIRDHLDNIKDTLDGADVPNTSQWDGTEDALMTMHAIINHMRGRKEAEAYNPNQPRDAQGRFGSGGGGGGGAGGEGGEASSSPESWDVWDVPSGMTDLYHVTSDVGNLTSIVQKGLQSGAALSSENIDWAGRVFVTTSRAQAEALLQRFRDNDGHPALLHLKLPQSEIQNHDPRVDPEMPGGESYALRASPRLTSHGLYRVHVAKGDNVPSLPRAWNDRVSREAWVPAQHPRDDKGQFMTGGGPQVHELTGVAQRIASDAPRYWGGVHSADDPVAALVRVGVADVFGGDVRMGRTSMTADDAFDRVGRSGGWIVLGGRKEDVPLDQVRQAVGAYIKAQYATTQAALAAGPPTVTLYRGTAQRYAGSEGGPVTSWSEDEGTAQRFGKHVTRAEIPRERILSSYKTGLGTPHEKEYLVLSPSAVSKVNEAWVPAQHPRGAKGQFAAGGGGGGEHPGGGVDASAARVPEHVREWIRAAGATVNGIQEVPIAGHPGIVLFTDHKTGSTSALDLASEITPAKIKQKIDEKQAALRAAQKKESQVTWGREDLILIGREAAETVQAWDTTPEEAFAYRYLAFPWRGLPRAIQAGVPVAAAAPSLLEAYRRSDPSSVVLRVPFTARTVANPRQVQILARTGWTPMQPADARWIEVEPGAFAADSADPITWDLPAVRLSPDAIERFPAMGGIALRDNGPWQADILRADQINALLLNPQAPPPPGRATRSLPSIVDALLDQNVGADPVLAVWDQDGLAVAARLADGRVLYARDAFAGLVPGVYQRVAVYCPFGDKVWAVRPRGHPYWVLPGGHIEPGESQTGAAVREMAEETGVPVRIIQPVGALHRPWSTTHVFLGTPAGMVGEPTTREEIDAAMPVDFEDLDPAERFWLRAQHLSEAKKFDSSKHPRDDKGQFEGGDVDECGAVHGPKEEFRCDRPTGHKGEHKKTPRETESYA